MSKHSLISTVAGLGLMAASMGASAQLHTFDYSSMYFGSAGTGGKYVAFVPTMSRGAGASDGAAGVLMLELFQPATGSASTWAYAVGGAVGADAGAGVTTGGADVLQTVTWTANNGLANAQNYYFGNNESIKLNFDQAVLASGVPAMSCNVAFVAEIGTNDQLQFKSVKAAPNHGDWQTAAGVVSVFSNSAGTAAPYTIAQADWDAMSVTTPAVVGASAKVDGIATSVGGTAATSLINMRNRCVPAYNNRATGGGVTPIVGGGLGFVRIW